MYKVFMGVVAIANAVPRIKEIIDMFYDLWIEKKIEDVNNSGIKLDEKRSALVKAISKADTNEDRRVLSIMLADIDRVSK